MGNLTDNGSLWVYCFFIGAVRSFCEYSCWSSKLTTRLHCNVPWPHVLITASTITFLCLLSRRILMVLLPWSVLVVDRLALCAMLAEGHGDGVHAYRLNDDAPAPFTGSRS